jgi:hypothetical protein
VLRARADLGYRNAHARGHSASVYRSIRGNCAGQ